MNTMHVLKNIIHPEKQWVQFSTLKLDNAIYISINYTTKEPKKITWVFSFWLGMKMSRPNLTLLSRKIKKYFIWVSWYYTWYYSTYIEKMYLKCIITVVSGEMTQLGKYLLYKHECLNSAPWAHINSTVVSWVCSLHPFEAETGGFLGFNEANQNTELQEKWETQSQNISWRVGDS